MLLDYMQSYNIRIVVVKQYYRFLKFSFEFFFFIVLLSVVPVFHTLPSFVPFEFLTMLYDIHEMLLQ